MPENTEKLANRLVSEAQKCAEYFRSLPAISWSIKIYTDGPKWDLHQLLAHFVSSELANTHLIKNVLAGGFGAPPEFDIDQYNEMDVQKYSNLGIDALIDNFINARQTLVDMVRQMNLDDLNKPCRHPFLGITKVEEIIKLIYLHNHLHIKDVKKVLAEAA